MKRRQLLCRRAAPRRSCAAACRSSGKRWRRRVVPAAASRGRRRRTRPRIAAPCHCSGPHRCGSPRRARAATARPRRSGRTGGSCIRSGLPCLAGQRETQKATMLSLVSDLGRDLDQPHLAVAPIALGLDPQAGPRFEVGAAVLILGRRRARAAAGRSRAGLVSLKDEMASADGLAERPPDALALAGQHEQAVGVVDLRADSRRAAARPCRRRTSR